MMRRGAGIAIGVALGAAVGAALDQVAVGVALGAAFGVALAALPFRQSGSPSDTSDAASPKDDNTPRGDQ